MSNSTREGNGSIGWDSKLGPVSDLRGNRGSGLSSRSGGAGVNILGA